MLETREKADEGYRREAMRRACLATVGAMLDMVRIGVLGLGEQIASRGIRSYEVLAHGSAY